jgi:hypothetical protein
VLAALPPYYEICVAFAKLEFIQLIISAHIGAALAAQMQAYADEYETEWHDLAAEE